VQRELRDGFSERLAELQRTYTETAQRAQEDANRGQAEIDGRRKQLAAGLAALEQVDAQLRGAG
jgi:hypothetical protein